MEAGDLDHGEEAADDKGGGDEVLGIFGAEIDAAFAGEDDGRGDDAG